MLVVTGGCSLLFLIGTTASCASCCVSRLGGSRKDSSPVSMFSLWPPEYKATPKTEGEKEKERLEKDVKQLKKEVEKLQGKKRRLLELQVYSNCYDNGTKRSRKK
eukprot:jgi/Psemu1/47473/gm1.47473_g